MGNSACAKRHFYVVGDLLLVFSKTYSKMPYKEDSDSQGHSKYISIERIS